MKFKSKIFVDEGDATRIALYLRSHSSKAKHELFKVMSPEGKLLAIKMKRKKKALKKRRD